MTYRLYIDEVGYASLKFPQDSRDPHDRHLSLTGIIIENTHLESTIEPALSTVTNRHFGKQVILHRSDIVARRDNFSCLNDPVRRDAFDSDLLQCLTDWNYSVITAVIDKQELLERYTQWRYDPYHYCLEVILERYVRWLQEQQTTGDVLAGNYSGGGKARKGRYEEYTR